MKHEKIENSLAQKLGGPDTKSRMRYKRVQKKLRKRAIRRSENPEVISKIYHGWEF